jgi:hypothetical protein
MDSELWKRVDNLLQSALQVPADQQSGSQKVAALLGVQTVSA